MKGCKIDIIIDCFGLGDWVKDIMEWMQFKYEIEREANRVNEWGQNWVVGKLSIDECKTEWIR